MKLSSVFNNFTSTKRWYLMHPIRFFRDMKYFFKAAWKRMTKGYCGMDVWNFSDWFCEIIPTMLKELADEANGYPYGLTPEKWHEILHEMATHIENAREDWGHDENPYELFSEEWKDYQKTQEEYKKNELKLGLAMLEEYFDRLWDQEVKYEE